jgi:hypothetical protein
VQQKLPVTTIQNNHQIGTAGEIGTGSAVQVETVDDRPEGPEAGNGRRAQGGTDVAETRM